MVIQGQNEYHQSVYFKLWEVGNIKISMCRVIFSAASRQDKEYFINKPILNKKQIFVVCSLTLSDKVLNLVKIYICG